MYCFSMFRKFFYDQSQPTETTPQIEIRETRPVSDKESVQSPPPNKKKEEKEENVKHEEDDDLFKEMTPNYVAPKRIGPTVLANDEKPSSIRFDMEVDHTHSWDVEELT